MSPEVAWSVPVRLAQANQGPLSLSLEADEAARARIARLLGLLRLQSFQAEVRVALWFDGAEVGGRWTALVTQTCGVSLEEFDTRIEGAFTVRAVPPSSKLAAPSANDAVIDPDAEDPPDVLEGDAVDVGAYLVEQLALEIDPFPRKPGAEFAAPAAEVPDSPFAVLQQLKREEPKG